MVQRGLRRRSPLSLIVLAVPICLVGCGTWQKATSQRQVLTTPSPKAFVLCAASELKAVAPHFGGEFSAEIFLQRPGLISYHVKRRQALAATFFIADLGPQDSHEKLPFDASQRRVCGYPAVATAMGGGVAILVAKRFRVQLDALDPSVSDQQRDSWLGDVDFKRLSAFAR